MRSDGLNFSFNLIYLNFTNCLEVLISFSIMVPLDEDAELYSYVYEIQI